jgi:hypothetical protein
LWPLLQNLPHLSQILRPFFFGWLKALRRQRLQEMEKLGDTLVNHFDGIAEYCALLKLKWATARPLRSASDLARFRPLQNRQIGEAQRLPLTA